MLDESEYLCDCQHKWRRRALAGCVFVTAVTLAMNCVLLLAFERHEAFSSSNETLIVKVIVRVLVMAVLDLMAVFIAYRIGHLKVSERVKNYAVLIALMIILALASLAHSYVYISLLFPCLAILIVPPFADMKLLNITFIETLLMSLVSCLLWSNRIMPPPLIKISVIVGVEGSCCVFYYFARSMLLAMLEQTKFVVDGWTEQERLISELKLEPLTRLYNRAAFQESISAGMGDFRHGGHEVTLAFIDLDNFKSVNDTFGHASGDAVLMAFAELLTGTFGTNRNVFRYGGDEFAVLFKDVPIEEVKITMETIREHYANMTFDFISGEMKVSASIGIAMYRAGMTSKEWITAADDAAYAAKSAGKNNVVVSKV